MKRLRFLLLAALYFTSVALVAQTKVSVLGDSYSTFNKHVQPHWNYVWYFGNPESDQGRRNDVRSVDQMWWQLLCTEMGYKMERNNSFSGSTVCYTGYNKEDQTDRSFITRMSSLGNPDIILILGGTNDSWSGAPIGEYQYKKWKRSDMFSFRPAFCYMLDYLKKNYPNARIINICNSELSPEVTETEAVVCKHYGITNVQLHDVEKQAGHPSVAGMRAICDQVKAVLK